MKRLITLLSLIICLTISFQAGAQIMSNYAFTSTTGAPLIDISVGSTTSVFSSNDDTPGALFDIGFTFLFMGSSYTQVSVSPDGFLKFGSPAATSQFTNSLTSTTNVPKLAPYWDDLATGTDGYVKYKTIGTQPTRQLVVEWRVTVPRNTTGPATATYQAILNESTGVIDYIYGAIPAGTSYSLGITSSSTQFASVTVSTNTVSYVTANDANADAITSGTKYTFTPPAAPTAPSGLTFSGVTQTGMTLNWIDNSSNELGFQIYRSTDNINFTFITTVAAGVTTYAATGLAPGQTYYWNVYAFNEGVLSAAASNNQATNPAGVITSIATGNWSATSTWSTGVVPIVTDNVTIADGHTVTIDVASTCNNLTVGGGTSGILQYEATTARTLTVAGNVTVVTNGTFQTATSGTVVTHALSLGGNLVVDGTFDMNIGTAGTGVTFTSSSDATISGCWKHLRFLLNYREQRNKFNPCTGCYKANYYEFPDFQRNKIDNY